MLDFVIVNGRVLRPQGLDDAPLNVAEGRISATAPRGAVRIDAGGCYVLPGMIDVHGDAFERVVMPRPGVTFPLALALLEADRQLLANGITTAYHGVTVSWEPGLRSLEHAGELIEAIRRARPDLGCDTRLHVRWETYALEAMDAVIGWVAGEAAPILSFNDHTTKSAAGRMNPSKLVQMAERANLGAPAFADLLAAVAARRDEVGGAIERMAARGSAAGAVLLAHDEETPEQRRWYRQLGARASEFPLTPETAHEARLAGEHIILGAPNVVRGISHNGSMNASEAISAGLCSVLATDYYYPAPLQAAFRLVDAAIVDLPAAWRLVAENPAEVVGLADRGKLTEGKRADIIIVARQAARPARVIASFVAGRQVYGADASRCG